MYTLYPPIPAISELFNLFLYIHFSIFLKIFGRRDSRTHAIISGVITRSSVEPNFVSISRNSRNLRFSSIFATSIGVMVAVWVLRGLEILTFIPSGVIWVLLLLSIVTGILSYLQNTKW
ncbi:hypothetical protein [Argonema galeatum]|uniref:hypothetical protein n=1 Tax=Argonema galeatum TaxID=2942762 RepID=UPI00201342F2|nr:hypothetical protein [Argonema galeatum]MCL1463596.1 hypothetical protein [Argonema galeatum A003/A1]